MKKIIITGSNGVLGQAFKEKIFVKKNKKKYKFVYLNSSICDLRDSKKTMKLFKRLNGDSIVHLAAISGGIGFSKSHHASMLRDNILMTFNILEAARINKYKKVLLTLTSGMYPEKIKPPYNETMIHEGRPLENNYGSSFAKRIMDPAIRAYRDEYNLDVIGLIPSGIFGPNDNFNIDHAPMLPATILKAYYAKKNNSKLKVWGNGKAIRDYTFSKDLRDIFIWALENYSSDLCLNVSSPEEHSIKEIVYKVCKNFKLNKKNVVFDKAKPNGILRKKSDISKFKKELNFKFNLFDKGLKITIDWFKKNISKNLVVNKIKKK